MKKEMAAAGPDRPVLRMGPDGLALCGQGMELRADLTKMLPRLRQANLQNEFIVKAARIRRHPGAAAETASGAAEAAAPGGRGWNGLLAVDATAGLGEDSILLAAAGYKVRMYEYDPVIAALLRDGLQRAAEVPELADIVARMELHEEDSIEAMLHLKDLGIRPDVVVLDPMFPGSSKTASAKKKFQLLRQLEQPCDNGEELLAAAVAADPLRIIIKRPVKGPYLGDLKPEYSLTGKAIRYDCISRRRNAEQTIAETITGEQK